MSLEKPPPWEYPKNSYEWLGAVVQRGWLPRPLFPAREDLVNSARMPCAIAVLKVRAKREAEHKERVAALTAGTGWVDPDSTPEQDLLDAAERIGKLMEGI